MCLIPRVNDGALSPRAGEPPLKAAYVGCGSSATGLLMNDSLHSDLTEAHERVAAMLDEESPPRAIVVVCPHWQTEEVVVTSAARPHLQCDYLELVTEYGGMPRPPGSPEVAGQIISLLCDGGVKCSADQQAPLVDAVMGSTMLISPGADVPVVSMSVLASLSSEEHVRIGTILQPLCKEGVLFLGVGLSSNIALSPNIEMLQTAGDTFIASAVTAFKEKLDLTVTGQRTEIGKALISWERFPFSRFNHPTEEHMMPLLVVAAAAGEAKATQIDGSYAGVPISNYVFQ